MEGVAREGAAVEGVVDEAVDGSSPPQAARTTRTRTGHGIRMADTLPSARLAGYQETDEVGASRGGSAQGSVVVVGAVVVGADVVVVGFVVVVGGLVVVVGGLVVVGGVVVVVLDVVVVALGSA